MMFFSPSKNSGCLYLCTLYQAILPLIVWSCEVSVMAMISDSPVICLLFLQIRFVFHFTSKIINTFKSEIHSFAVRNNNYLFVDASAYAKQNLYRRLLHTQLKIRQQISKYYCVLFIIYIDIQAIYNLDLQFSHAPCMHWYFILRDSRPEMEWLYQTL